MDGIFSQCMGAIVKARPELMGWVDEKSIEFENATRLDVLRWIAFSLDARNKQIVAQELGVSLADLEGLKRVLQVT